MRCSMNGWFMKVVKYKTSLIVFLGIFTCTCYSTNTGNSESSEFFSNNTPLRDVSVLYRISQRRLSWIYSTTELEVVMINILISSGQIDLHHLHLWSSWLCWWSQLSQIFIIEESTKNIQTSFYDYLWQYCDARCNQHSFTATEYLIVSYFTTNWWMQESRRRLGIVSNSIMTIEWCVEVFVCFMLLSHLLQRFLFHLRHRDKVEDDSDEGDDCVGPECSIQPQPFPQINEGLDSSEGAEITEGCGDGGSCSSGLERKYFTWELFIKIFVVYWEKIFHLATATTRAGHLHWRRTQTWGPWREECSQCSSHWLVCRRCRDRSQWVRESWWDRSWWGEVSCQACLTTLRTLEMRGAGPQHWPQHPGEETGRWTPGWRWSPRRSWRRWPRRTWWRTWRRRWGGQAWWVWSWWWSRVTLSWHWVEISQHWSVSWPAPPAHQSDHLGATAETCSPPPPVPWSPGMMESLVCTGHWPATSAEQLHTPEPTVSSPATLPADMKPGDLRERRSSNMKTIDLGDEDTQPHWCRPETMNNEQHDHDLWDHLYLVNNILSTCF